jgi:hypothetical protein
LIVEWQRWVNRVVSRMREALPLFVHFRTSVRGLRVAAVVKAATIEAATTSCGTKRNCSAS